MKNIVDGFVLAMMILFPALLIRIIVLLSMGIVLDLWLTFLGVGLVVFALLKLHQWGVRNPVGELVLWAMK